MSRSRRKLPYWAKNPAEWEPGFTDRLQRGQVELAKPEILKGRARLSSMTNEVWGRRANKLRKKLITKQARAEGRRNINSVDL